jgi:predicted O-methyltransferase YrrM
MNYLAAWYGDSISRVSEIEPSKLNWPTKTMPIHLASCAQEHNPTSLNIVNVMIADSKVNWENEPFVSNSKIRAVLSDDSIQIQPQPVYGSGKLQRNKYISLESKNSQIPDEFNIKNLEDALIASFTKISTLRFSAWSSLIPTLYILFSFLKPRRYVELGTHYGTSFFAACQANQEFDTNTQCIAIDSWIGDEHASFYSDDVFCNFKQHMKENYPDQQYIRGYFSQALNCFEDGSIDLLHIDGFHTYDAVKSDFDAWLPKLSKCGVIILHDTEVYERNFGVWRLLSELKKNYSCFNVPHGHGLGIVYVGREPSPISYWLSYFANQVDVSSLVNIYLEAIGTLSVETKNMIDKMAELKNLLAQACEERDDSISKLTLLTDDRNIIVSSISWRITSPIREFRNRYPRVSGQIRRIIKLVWWTITGKLYSRLKEKVSSVESVGK